MKPRRKLTDAQIEEIVRLRELGHSYEWIAAKVGFTANAVAWQCCRLGAEAPNSTARSWDRIQGPAVQKRGDHVVRRFTPQEDALLLALASGGIIHSEIARRMGRKPNSIYGRLMALARREARREAVA